MKIGYKTDTGMQRKKNEDSFLILDEYAPNLLVLAVADGMGGHNAGEVASKIAIDKLKEAFDKNQNILLNDIEAGSLEDIVDKINLSIFNKGQNNPEYNGMGTTLSFLIYYNRQLIISHIGDSRIYKIDNKGINQLTEDHSLVAKLIEKGEITKEQANNHPQKNIITRALGTEEKIKSDIYYYETKEEDIILLCTDGLTNMVSEEDIKNVIKENQDFQLAAEKLVKLANDKGGTDNITLILFQS